MPQIMKVFLFASLMVLAAATLAPVFFPSLFATDHPRAQSLDDPRMPYYWRKYMDSYDEPEEFTTGPVAAMTGSPSSVDSGAVHRAHFF
jgi:hypothetical protein